MSGVVTQPHLDLKAPPPLPELPQLEEPLGTHLRDLLEEVSP